MQSGTGSRAALVTRGPGPRAMRVGATSSVHSRPSTMSREVRARPAAAKTGDGAVSSQATLRGAYRCDAGATPAGASQGPGLRRQAAALARSVLGDSEGSEDAGIRELGFPPVQGSHLRRTGADPKIVGRRSEPPSSHPVVAFLREAGLERYAEVVLESGFDDMETLMLIEDEDCRDLGFVRGHIVKLRQRLRQYQASFEPEQVAPLEATTPPDQHPRLRRQRQAPTPAAAGELFGEVRISLLEHSWERVNAVGVNVVGGLLCKHTLAIAPEAAALFPADLRRRYREWTAEEGDDDEDDSEDLLRSPGLRNVFGKIISAVGSVVAGLHDMVELIPRLSKLGARHVAYGVSEEHWGIAREAMDRTLREALGETYTEEVRQAWITVYDFTAAVMIDGFRAASA
mmetsp:Transcript_94957/g.274595  ORF Transcript_94957/g.274595 Transcript_94957/m.274595 type:complete len:401 (-) Transcript_94957:397-1599(-)